MKPENGYGNCPNHCLDEMVLLYGIILTCPNQCPNKG